jgi:hypothetical protein
LWSVSGRQFENVKGLFIIDNGQAGCNCILCNDNGSELNNICTPSFKCSGSGDWGRTCN